MKEEVPLSLVEAHMKTVDEAIKEGKDIASMNYQLEKTGIAGTEKEEPAKSPSEGGARAPPIPGTTTDQGLLNLGASPGVISLSPQWGHRQWGQRQWGQRQWGQRRWGHRRWGQRRWGQRQWGHRRRGHRWWGHRRWGRRWWAVGRRQWGGDSPQ